MESRSIVYEGLEAPGSSSVILTCVGVWLLILNYNASYETIGIIYSSELQSIISIIWKEAFIGDSVIAIIIVTYVCSHF
jgi:hypothetical protein